MNRGYAHIMRVLCILLFAACGDHSPPGPSYTVETISMPAGLTSETGAIAFLPNGKLVASFTRGEVLIYDPAKKTWKLFAEGLHDPLGIYVVSNSELLIMQRPELTRVKDTDGDGSADLYENVTDAFGISGNYHEFSYGPVKDKNGNFFIALNASSPGGSMRKEVRGVIDTLGRDGNGNGQMFSAVPYRGWVMKLTPAGDLIPVASGLRSPNGIGFDLKEIFSALITRATGLERVLCIIYSMENFMVILQALSGQRGGTGVIHFIYQ